MRESIISMVGIGIATKNRWDDLKTSLSKIAALKLGGLKILIFDDASDRPCPFDAASICAGAELKRFPESKGYIVRRNQLARAMDSKYYLSLDDDSFPVSGSLESAVEFAESRSDLLCLSFPVYNPLTGRHEVKTLQDTPYRVQTLVGCGHLLHRERFLGLGGYCEDLIHQGEELELAARAFHEGLHCYHFPGFNIHHMISGAGRNWYRMDFYGARNNVLWNDWFMPRGLRIVKQSRTLTSRVLLFLKTGRIAHLQGQVAGLTGLPRYRANRRLMPLKLYQQWKKLPSS